MSNSDVILKPRVIATYIDVLREHFPTILAHSRGTSYAGIEFVNPADSAVATEAKLNALILPTTMISWVRNLFEEANALQILAASYHAFAVETTSLQLTLYDMKYKQAKAYLDQRALSLTPEAVPIPDIIATELAVTQDTAVDLSTAIVANYLASNSSLSIYYGTMEGERRMAKRRVMACTSIAELQNVQWANWVDYEPNIDIEVGD